MSAPLIINEAVSLEAPMRRGFHAQACLDSLDDVLAWVGDAHDPVLRLVDAAGADEEAGKARLAWKKWVAAQAADIYADAGMEALAWPQAVVEAVYTLVKLHEFHGQGFSHWAMKGNRARLEISPSIPAKATPSLTAAGDLADQSKAKNQTQWRVLTMDDVLRELENRSATEVLDNTQDLCDILPQATLPMLAIATAAWQTIEVAGNLTGFDTISLGDENTPWHAQLTWVVDPHSVGPTGEAIEL